MSQPQRTWPATYLRRGGVLRFNGATGAFIDAFIPAESEVYGGIAFGPDGNLYVNSPSTHRVLRFNGTTGAFMDVFVSNATSPLAEPAGLIFGANGSLYVCSSDGGAVLRYNSTTGAYLHAPMPPKASAEESGQPRARGNGFSVALLRRMAICAFTAAWILAGGGDGWDAPCWAHRHRRHWFALCRRSMTLRAGCSFVDTFGIVPLPDPRSLQPSMLDVSSNHLDRVLARASFWTAAAIHPPSLAWGSWSQLSSNYGTKLEGTSRQALSDN